MIALLARVWHARWSLVRSSLAAALLWTLLAGVPAQLARLKLSCIPDMDFAAEIRALRAQGRYAEALTIADAAPTDTPVAADIARERQLTVDEQSSWLRRAKDLGTGALLGRGETLEELIGAVATDLLVVGDVRDLVIQGINYSTGQSLDPVITALSTFGLVTTFAPEIDWVPSLFKFARKAGHLTDRLGESIVTAVKGKNAAQLERLVTDGATLARHTSPSAAARALRLAEDPADLARLAAFASRAEGKSAALALHVAGEETASLLKSAQAAGVTAADLDAAVLRAARKGRSGIALLASDAGRALLHPHPFVGLLKAFWKGTLPDLLARGLEALDPHLRWALPAVAAWFALELAVLLARLLPPKRVTHPHRTASNH